MLPIVEVMFFCCALLVRATKKVCLLAYLLTLAEKLTIVFFYSYKGI